ncbi:hypothetical protein C8R46DRAFT_1226151 [Mycena filopes]|nr:hypothetical protein C8R46DRAFT_1226151 [Mycena filopes]
MACAGVYLYLFPTFLASPLLVFDYEKVLVKDEAEIAKLWSAATTHGFWYLKNHGAHDLVEGMFEMAAETMLLPLEEKLKYEQGDGGNSFGSAHSYKAAGANAVDATQHPSPWLGVRFNLDSLLVSATQKVANELVSVVARCS